MLCKRFGTRKALARAQWGVIFLGAVMLGTCLVLSRMGRMDGQTIGFYLGAGSGMVTGGLVMRLEDRWRRRTPERAEQADRALGDERNQEINRRAQLQAGEVQMFALIAAMLVAWPLNKAVFWTAFALLWVYAFSYLGAYAYCWRKL